MASASALSSTSSALRDLFAGIDVEVPVLDGSLRRYVNFDNAATTPPLKSVLEHLNDTAHWYSSVHRGSGFKSKLSTHAFDCCRDHVARFLGADPNYHIVTFCSNATDALNRLGCRLALRDDESILTTVMEHHSNLLPWRYAGRVEYIESRWPCGILDIEQIEEKLRAGKGRVRLVAVTGASNVTGLIPPLRRIARLAHAHGALLLVDAAQLIAHRPIRMGRGNDPERIDFLVFSGHKMYAPFGSGALIGPREFFDNGRPGMIGGGAVDVVTRDDVEWNEAPDKEEAGSPNLLGICAIARAMKALDAIGMDTVVAHERALTAYAIERLRKIPGVRIFGGCDDMQTVGCGGNGVQDAYDRLGVISFLVDRYSHGLMAAVLGYEWGIGVRNGCFCAQLYIGNLLGVGAEQVRETLNHIRQGERPERPGFVRVSLGLYNTEQEVDYLAGALETILREGHKGKYQYSPESREYVPENFAYDFDAVMK